MWWKKMSTFPVLERALLIQTPVTWGHKKWPSKQARILFIYIHVYTSEFHKLTFLIHLHHFLLSNFVKPGVGSSCFHFPGVFFFPQSNKKYFILVSKLSGFTFIQIKLFHSFSLRVIIMLKFSHYYFYSLYPVAIYFLWGC